MKPRVGDKYQISYNRRKCYAVIREIHGRNICLECDGYGYMTDSRGLAPISFDGFIGQGWVLYDEITPLKKLKKHSL